MSQIKIDTQKAIRKWAPVLENMGVKDANRIEWMSEMAEYTSINENAYANANIAGMGNVISAQPSYLAGSTVGNNWSANGGRAGSGDIGQNLLPVAMKIAAQTIGLDLVAVKPTPGPKIDLLYIDFRYDDLREDSNEHPQVFELYTSNLKDVRVAIQGELATNGITETTGGLTGRLWILANGTTTTNEPAGSKAGVMEFLGFSRISGYPMFRAYRQANVSGGWAYDQTKNTFVPNSPILLQLEGVDVAGVSLTDVGIDLVSALEDHIPGFSANWYSGKGFAGDYPMDRDTDDKRYAGIIAPKISTKSVAVGTIEVASALRRTEIEDIKANTGMDIVQKMESVLVNELSQTISKQIVSKIFEMGELNRASAPLRAGTPIFDLDTSYATNTLGGETTHAVQRKLITRIMNASNFIATEGRVGPAQYLVTNGGLAAALSDISGYTLNPVKSKINASGQLYPVGSIGDIDIYVDPYMKYNDNRIALGRKNNPDQPGIIFVPYLMAQSISLISEATNAPKITLRSRYAITEVGWFPQKQYMTIHVTDDEGFLN